jgi:uncharacterized protein (TIGR02466 family)
MTKKEKNIDEIKIMPLFTNPLMVIQLDLDLEKLTDFAFQIQNKNKKGVHFSNEGGWQSNNICEEKHEEFIRLKKEINQYLQTYHLRIFRGMEFKENVIQNMNHMWVNINEKYHYNEWHIHGFSTLSGVYYIKHDGSDESGNILFKHPLASYVSFAHWPPNIVEYTNEITAHIYKFTPKPNMLLIFPSWLEHSTGINFKDDSRISLSFNSDPILEKKS